MITKEKQEEFRAKYNPDGSSLRTAQLKMLELLEFLDKICTENGLRYWMDSGTLLGAVRHGGFIPWDDDVDVVMPLEDAKQLKKIMGNKIWDDHIILQHKGTDKNYIRSSWLTLRDTKSAYIQDSPMHNRLRYRGFQVDIFVHRSGVPKLSKLFARAWYLTLIHNPLTNDNLKGRILRPFVNFNSQLLERIIIPILSGFTTKSPFYTGFLGNPFKSKHHKDNIFPLKKVDFEGVMLSAPNNPAKYLQETYGNWEKIPNNDEILTHNADYRLL